MDPFTLSLLIGGISAGGSLLGGMSQASAAKDASAQQAQAAQQALNFQKHVYNESQQNFRPYLQTGEGALHQLAGLYGLPGGTSGTPGMQNFNAFTQSPDYQFAQQQGNLAIQRSGAAQGNYLSGGQIKAGEQFGQGLASQQYGNYFNRLMGLATMGQNSAANSATSGGNMANTIGNTQLAQGAYQGAGTIGQANAYSSIFPNALSSYGTMRNFANNSAFSQPNTQSGGSSMWSPTG